MNAAILLRALGLIQLGQEIAFAFADLIGEQKNKTRINLDEITDELDAEIASGRELLAKLRARGAAPEPSEPS